MIMPQPDPSREVQLPAPRQVGFHLLGAVILLPGIAGGTLLIAYAIYWAGLEFQFRGDERIAAPIFTILGTIGVLVSVFFAAVWLRFSQWKTAPAASLWISMIGIVTILLAFAMSVSTLESGDAESWLVLSAMSVAALLVVCLPPLLFWYRSDNRGGQR